ncbi:transposase [Nocardia abscessus]|nr:transposase [Nocardia abscessus]
MPETNRVIGGADTHADTIHVAVISMAGQPITDQEFATTAAGYRAAIEFLTSHGVPHVVGVEGTSSYGAGFTRALVAAGIPVLEVCRPDKATRRRCGKSDVLDAYSAARSALSGHGVSEPKDARIGVVRALLGARRSAVKARTASINQIKALLVTAPEAVRPIPQDRHQAADHRADTSASRNSGRSVVGWSFDGCKSSRRPSCLSRPAGCDTHRRTR